MRPLYPPGWRWLEVMWPPMLPCFQIDILVSELKSFSQWLEGGDFAESQNSYMLIGLC